MGLFLRFKIANRNSAADRHPSPSAPGVAFRLMQHDQPSSQNAFSQNILGQIDVDVDSHQHQRGVYYVSNTIGLGIGMKPFAGSLFRIALYKNSAGIFSAAIAARH